MLEVLCANGFIFCFVTRHRLLIRGGSLNILRAGTIAMASGERLQGNDVKSLRPSCDHHKLRLWWLHSSLTAEAVVRVVGMWVEGIMLFNSSIMLAAYRAGTFVFVFVLLPQKTAAGPCFSTRQQQFYQQRSKDVQGWQAYLALRLWAYWGPAMARVLCSTWAVNIRFASNSVSNRPGRQHHAGRQQ
jgi:hypothetical protein